MRARCTGGLAAAVLFGLAACAWAGPGQSAGQILQQDQGARPAALAGAYTAFGSDLECVGKNPAGLAGLEQAEVKFMHLGGVEGLTTEWLAGAVPVPGLGTLAAQVLYRGQPAIDNQVPGEAPVDVRDLLFGAAVAFPVVPGLEAGLNAKLLLLTLGPVDTSALAADLGVRYALDGATRLGLALRQLGTGVKFRSAEDPLPQTFSLGASRVLLPDGVHELEAALDLDYLVPDQNWTARLGAEYRFKRILALRLGYAYSAARTVNSFSAGVGFRFALGRVGMSLDYALRPQLWETGDFDLQNVLTLGARF
jgi:hypothetical protein